VGTLWYETHTKGLYMVSIDVDSTNSYRLVGLHKRNYIFAPVIYDDMVEMMLKGSFGYMGHINDLDIPSYLEEKHGV
jgi:hypothetical protein